MNFQNMSSERLPIKKMLELESERRDRNVLFQMKKKQFTMIK